MSPNTVYCGDSIKLLADWPAGCVDLAFADPPFNIGYVYDRYKDDMPDEQYVAWTKQWMAACVRVLKPTGSFYIAIGDEFAADIRIIGRELGLFLRNWIIWHYSFGQNCKTKFSRAHTHIFYFTRDPKKYTFNDKLLRHPSARHTEYQDLRANPLGRLPDDVWDEFPRVCGTFAERAGFHGCQMPEALLMRIVAASSDPGEVVLDPFNGSGTTAVAAQRFGRKYVGIDLSAEYVRQTQERLARTAKQDQQPQVDGWPALHVDMLAQLYRETGVTLDNLLPNDVALKVMAIGLSARVGRRYDAAELQDQLKLMRARLALPKLPNDREFTAADHERTEGKRYVRRIKRVQKRQTPPGQGLLNVG